MRACSQLVTSRLATFTIAALSGALLYCSSDPSQPDVIGGSGDGSAAAGTTGSGGVAQAGSAAAGTTGSGGVSSAGMGGAVTGGGGSGAGGVAGASAGSGGVPTQGGGGAGGGNVGGGVSTACGSGAILCEDFEQYPAASPPAGGWTTSARGNGKIVVDTTRAFTGKQSLHVTGQMTATRSNIANISRPIQTESPSAYVRFMYYPISYPASSGVHTRLMRIGTAQAASGNPDSSYSLATYNGTAIEKVNSIYLRDTGTKLNDPKLLNRWTCLEFAIDRSGGVGKVKVQLWVDGRELPLSPAGSSSHGMTSNSWDPIPFELFMLGLDGFQNDSQAADFWIDDLSVTPERVGCQAPPP